MAFNISDFISSTTDFARPSNFEVSIFTPWSSTNQSQTNLLVSGTELPASPVQQIPVYYFGRAIKVAGNREFPNWPVEVLNDIDFSLRIMFENWSNKINTLISNRQDSTVVEGAYKSSGLVTQYGLDGSVLRTYNLYGLWPVQVSPIRLSWQDGNAIETYNVEFSIDYWEPTGVGNADDYSGTLSSDSTGS